jgi:uncharacterized membrane protein YidH (DUF202 family)
MAALAGSAAPPAGAATISLGVVLVLAGPALVGLAAVRFWQTERDLLRDQPPSRRTARVLVLAVTGAALIAGVALALHLVTTWPD